MRHIIISEASSTVFKKSNYFFSLFRDNVIKDAWKTKRKKTKQHSQNHPPMRLCKTLWKKKKEVNINLRMDEKKKQLDSEGEQSGTDLLLAVVYWGPL